MKDKFTQFAIVAMFLSTTLGASLYLCSDFLDEIRASSLSQKRAAWAQVYWVRRGQLYEERTWQDDWNTFTAKYSVEYCRVKLQRKDTAEFIDRLEEDIRKQEEIARTARARRAHAAETFRGHALEP